MDWKLVDECKHEWTDYYEDGQCGTPYCKWTELHCRKCGVFVTTCGCHFMDQRDGWSQKRRTRHASKDHQL